MKRIILIFSILSLLMISMNAQKRNYFVSGIGVESVNFTKFYNKQIETVVILQDTFNYDRWIPFKNYTVISAPGLHIGYEHVTNKNFYYGVYYKQFSVLTYDDHNEVLRNYQRKEIFVNLGYEANLGNRVFVNLYLLSRFSYFHINETLYNRSVLDGFIIGKDITVSPGAGIDAGVKFSNMLLGVGVNYSLLSLSIVKAFETPAKVFDYELKFRFKF